VLWQGTDEAGRSVSAGVYFIRMEAGTHSANEKVTILR